MDAATYLIAAMRDRPDRIAWALWEWLRRASRSTQELAVFLGCTLPALERLALVPRPQPGADWDDDVTIIEISLRLRHGSLRAILSEVEAPSEREYGA